MNNMLSNLIVPRINLNSNESIEYAELLTKKYYFDSFILFSTDKVLFGENSKFTMKKLFMVRDLLEGVSSKNILFFLDAENGLGKRCFEGSEFDLTDIELLDNKTIATFFDAINSELYRSKINVNLAPVLDIKDDKSMVLNGRTFSKNPDRVSEIGSIFLKSAAKNKVIACTKHFPGHGVHIGDTHNELIKSGISSSALMNHHLRPFKDLIQSTDLIMMNHINYIEFDSEPLPASMSYKIMTDLLLNKMSYKGLIISDSIRMKAITSNFTESLMVKNFILNGGDLILDPIDPINCLRDLEEIYIESKEKIDKKINRILKFKEKAEGLI